jgi:hypothetical protein
MRVFLFKPTATFLSSTLYPLHQTQERTYPMADISAIFFILLILSIAFPAMLTAWWLFFPALIARAQMRIAKSLASSFWLGLIVVLILGIPIFILLALPFGPAKLIGWIGLGASLTVSSIGSAGIAAHLAERLSHHGSFSPLSGFVRSTVILELAAFFPVIGWLFIWIPLLLVAFGATAFALLNWMPREKTQISSAATSPSHV